MLSIKLLLMRVKSKLIIFTSRRELLQMCRKAK